MGEKDGDRKGKTRTLPHPFWKSGRFRIGRSGKALFGILLFLMTVLSRSGSLHGQGRIDGFEFGMAQSREPIHIQAGRLEIQKKEGRAIYKGNVVAKQGKSTLHSETLTIHFDPKGGGVQRIVAEGSVRILSEGRTATAGRAEFDHLHRTVVLLENPTVIQGQDVIRGSRITVFLDQQRSLVVSEPGQKVSTTIVPKQGAPREEERHGRP